MTRKKIYILMVLSAVFWAGASIAGKYAVPYIPPVTLTFLRFLFASMILGVVMRHRKEDYRLNRRNLPIFLFTGVVGILGYHVLFFTSLIYTTATNAAIIAAANPIATIVLSGLFLKQRLSVNQLAGIIISFIGVILTIIGADINVLKELAFNIGDILMLIAVTVWAAYSVFSKSKAGGVPALALTYYSFLICTVTIIPFVLLEKPWTFLTNTPATAYIAVLYMSIFSSAIAYLVQQISIKEIGPSRTAIFVNLVPIFAIVMAVLILGEEFQPVKLLTAGLIIFGVFICQRTTDEDISTI